jgi:hypothetical protein
MAVQFQKKDGRIPFPRTAEEWTAAGLSPAQADHKMCQDVFGHDYKIDAKGYPIERGKGSALQPSSESLKAIEREKSAAEQAKMRLGWHKGLENSFDPRLAP